MPGEREDDREEVIRASEPNEKPERETETDQEHKPFRPADHFSPEVLAKIHEFTQSAPMPSPEVIAILRRLLAPLPESENEPESESE
jgi:hypothetical protein